MARKSIRPAGDMKVTHDFRKTSTEEGTKTAATKAATSTASSTSTRRSRNKSVTSTEAATPAASQPEAAAPQSSSRRRGGAQNAPASSRRGTGRTAASKAATPQNSANASKGGTRGRSSAAASADGRGGRSSSGRKAPKAAANTLRIVPLGGLNEIGKNMTALEYGDSILLIDCGMSFPEDEMFGIDVVIPDFDYLEQNKKKLKALVITHGHEDHIGGVPYLLKRMNVPVYGTGLSLGLIESKLAEHGIKGDLRRVNAGQKLSLGHFKVELIHTTHSIADALCLAITTPVGTVFHTGDYKIDYTPVDGEHIDLQKLAEIGSKGVLLLMSDSTNATRKGHTDSEQKLTSIMDNIFRDTKSRIIIATFASNIHRVQTIINAAAAHKRKVALSGRSMLKVLDIAMDMGYVKIQKNQLVNLDEIRKIPDKELVVITTGSQGEPMSALSRIASGAHREISVKRGDKIVLSSSPIPGNEKSVSNIVNRLLELGADVIYSDIADIHVSGHACEDEHKLMLSLIKPQYFMPVHGEVRHLRRHAAIAEELGWPKSSVFLLSNGDALDIAAEGQPKFHKGVAEAEPVFVDGLGVGDISSLVLRDRKQLSESGLIIVMATVDSVTGKILSGPDIVSRGFVYVRDNEDLMEELREVASDKLLSLETKGGGDYSTLKNGVRDELKRYIFRKTKRNPVILPIFMEA